MEITIKPQGLDEAIRGLNDLQMKQVPFATAKALTQTAKEVQSNIIGDMKKVFDRPTPYTLGSLYVKPATKQSLTSKVWLREFAGKGIPATKYLFPEIFGGDRSVKRFEKALKNKGILPPNMYVAPGSGAQLDAYGNINRGQIVKILSYMGAFGEQGYRANITDKRKQHMSKGTKKQRGQTYFVSRGRGTLTASGKQQHLPPGIYSRTSFAWGSAIKPVFKFVRNPAYRKRLPFYETAEKMVMTRFEPLFKQALFEAIKAEGL